MKIETTWTFGNFSITAATSVETAEPVGPVMAALAEKGFLQLLQRVPASNAEKVLAGYEKRPAGFKRDSIPYSEDNALKLIEAFGTSVEVEEGVKLAFSITDVKEHTGSDAVSSRKMATEMMEKVKGNGAMLLAMGCAADATEEEIVEACHKFLAGLRKKGTK